MKQLRIAEWLHMPLPPEGFYKECRIDDTDNVGKGYVLLTLLLPLPGGGEHRELVSVDDTLIDVHDDK